MSFNTIFLLGLTTLLTSHVCDHTNRKPSSLLLLKWPTFLMLTIGYKWIKKTVWLSILVTSENWNNNSSNNKNQINISIEMIGNRDQDQLNFVFLFFFASPDSILSYSSRFFLNQTRSHHHNTKFSLYREFSIQNRERSQRIVFYTCRPHNQNQ